MMAHRLCSQLLFCIPKLEPALECVCQEHPELPYGGGEGPTLLQPRRGLLSHPLVAQAVALPVSGDWWRGEAASYRCVRTGGPPAEPGRAGASRGACGKNRGRVMAGAVGREQGKGSGELGFRSGVWTCPQLSWVRRGSHEANSSFPLTGCLPFLPSITNSQREGLRCPGPVPGHLCQAAS